MKKLLCILLGILSAFTISKYFIGEDSIPAISLEEANTAYIFQIGVYNNRSKAESLSKNNKGIVIEKDNKYYVYVGILKNKNNINKLKTILDKKNIKYYQKEEQVNNIFYTKLEELENLMENTKTEVAFNKINETILDYYKETYED